jgi:hypothetical protein
MIVGWLRPAAALFALAGLLALGGCGGGSGAPNNPYNPPPPPPGPVFVLPATLTAFSNTPTTLAISGGAAPFSVFSSNPSVLPVAQVSTNGDIVLLPGNVSADTTVLITVQDAIGQRASSSVTVRPAPIFNTLVIKPSSAACGANTICSGQTGSATVTVLGPGGIGIPNRQVRFDVVDGAFAIQSNNPATPLVQTLTVVSDANGVATVFIQANFGAATQPAVLRATELTTGNQVNGLFTIVAAALTVIPNTVTVTGPDTSTCFGGAVIDYFIYGGSPPYHVSSTIPSAVVLTNSTVTTSGGSFRVTTTGQCVNPAIFSIVDSTGLQTTANLVNLPGTAAPAPPPTPGVFATPGAIDATMTGCNGVTFTVFIAGGTPPYNVSPTGGFDLAKPAPLVVPQVLAAAGGVQISGLLDNLSPPAGRNRYDFLVTDATGGIDNFHILCTP